MKKSTHGLKFLLTVWVFVGWLTACTTSSTPPIATAPPASTPPLTTATRPAPRDFQGDLAYTWVLWQCDLGYRITGTEANRRAGDMILEALRMQGWSVREETFTYRGTPVRNLLAWKGEGPALLLGAHYDTRRAADRENPSIPVMGANDGASGVAVLLELARTLEFDKIENQVYLAFFDAEDNGQLNGWDWIVGSQYMADHWGSQGEPALTAMVLVDMIGDADQQIYYERHSTGALAEEIWDVAHDLGYTDRFFKESKYALIDDHVPFLEHGIPSVDIIDFDYPYWHTTQDTIDKVSAESLASVGRTLEVWLEKP
ncbi:MAG: M28 family peptidase [Anaerolineae bacterium]|nr:M28 family peptidase [Anaerolineae bacterium]